MKLARIDVLIGSHSSPIAQTWHLNDILLLL